MNLPKPIKNLIDSFERLPGIGPKTAARLTFYLLHVPQEMLDEFGDSLKNLKKDTVNCSICFNFAEADPCPICSDIKRDHTMICVVEQPLDILAIEKTGKYQGIYHVLGGAISPLNNIGPDELKIDELLTRLRFSSFGEAREIILATNPNMEGEATAMFISNEIKKLPARHAESDSAGGRINELRITRLAHGLPVGGDLEYADEVTLQRALEGRREY